MKNEIENIEFELPINICLQVCVVSFLLAGFLGLIYGLWGVLIAGFGGLGGALLWCKWMRRIFALPTRSTVAIYVIGILLGVAVGAADGILLHVIGINLQKSTLWPGNYSEAIITGTLWGTSAGLANGMFWGRHISKLHEYAWKYMEGVAQNITVNEYDFDNITRVVKISKGADNE